MNRNENSEKGKSPRVDGEALFDRIADLEFAVRTAENQDYDKALETLVSFLKGLSIQACKAVWGVSDNTYINTMLLYFVHSPDEDMEDWNAIDRFYVETYWPSVFNPAGCAGGDIEVAWREGMEKANMHYSDCMSLAEEIPWEKDFFMEEAQKRKQQLIADGQKEFASREEAQHRLETALADLLRRHRYKWDSENWFDDVVPKPNIVMHVASRDLLESFEEIERRLKAAGFGKSLVGAPERGRTMVIVASFLDGAKMDMSTSLSEEEGKPNSLPEVEASASEGDLDPSSLKIALGDYLETKDGQETLSFFHAFPLHFRERFKTTEFRHFVERNLDVPAYEGDFDIGDEDFPFDFSNPPECKDFNGFYAMCDRLFAAPDIWADVRYVQCLMPQLSCILFSLYPDYAFPYLLPVHFFKVKEIFRRLGIPLPKMPARNDHEGRCRYLLNLFVVLYRFRTENGFSPEEMCCLLYGYMPRFLVSYVRMAPVPANRVCIVGATKHDAESDLLQKPKEGDISVWQGNAEMTPGDIVLVYETSPYCRISSIWRAVSPGFDDPFDYYSGKVIVGHPMKIPPIEFGELAVDAVWGKKGLIKGHMIGVSGQSCTVEEYEALKKLIQRKNPRFPLETLPMPPEYAQFFHENIKVERDVETQLLEPLLKQLGFASTDWVRQLELRMGRGDRVFPDYALFVSGDKNNRAAEFVWEAKYRIPSERQLEIDFGQAKSYALRLQSKALGLVALEGIWVVGADSGFNFRKLLHYTWKELEHPETLNKVKQVFRRG